jgi:biotin operon repressor
MRSATKHDLQAILSRHVGHHNGITAQALAGLLDVPARAVRHLVTELREDGVAVCGKPETGYFIAANDEELLDTCEYLHARAMHSLRVISILRQVPLPDLRGQLRLKT